MRSSVEIDFASGKSHAIVDDDFDSWFAPRPMAIATLRRSLLGWYDRVQRPLPWRETRDPYAILVSEVMLQQTRVETVIPYYTRFLEKFPSVEALSAAPRDAVLSQWSGLGYYRRARLLHAAAHAIAARGGSFPSTVAELREIPGIGAYTAGAVASIAFQKNEPLVDGNVIRVIARLYALGDDMRKVTNVRKIWDIARDLVPSDRPGDFNQALMELGATICTPRDPDCVSCPVGAQCAAKRLGIAAKLPVLAPKEKPRRESFTALVVRDARGRTLVGRRRADGVFGGMWEPPVFGEHIDTDPLATLAELAKSAFGVKIADLSRAGKTTHVLSHRHMSIDVIAGSFTGRPALRQQGLYDQIASVSEPELEARGVTRLARKVVVLAQSAWNVTSA